MPARIRTVDTPTLIALHEAEVALRRAELELARLRAGLTPVAAAPKPAAAPTPKPKPAAPKPKPAKPAPKPFTGQIANPDAPATARQLWALHLYTPGHPDTRGWTLTRAEAAARIAAAKAARKTAPVA